MGVHSDELDTQDASRTITPAQSVNQLLSVYNSTMAVKKMTASSCPPKRPRLRLSAHANVILRGRYLGRNVAGTIVETAAQLFWRVATDIARAEQLYPTAGRLSHAALRWYECMARLDFLPNSPTLMNAGRRLQQLSACFVLPVEDSLASIYDGLKHQALIHQSGGGTGFSFSHLRPHNDRVASSSGVASGPISFMRLFNLSTDVIKQGGTRRGANMGILRIDHPDILDFIALKQTPTEMTNFNLSVGITDSFMQALTHRRTYALINPLTNKPTGRFPAQLIFDRLVEAAWTSGEPGLVFLDTINRANPTPRLGTIESTNPCGEQPLLAYESCTLGSINVANFVTQPDARPTIDFARLAETISLAVRFLDNVIDRNHFPLLHIDRMTKQTRKIGLGIMGFADLLIALNIPYNSEAAFRTATTLMDFFQSRAHLASTGLAAERGAFPAYRGSRLQARHQRHRNATVTTIAPTGSISLIAGCSPGIEPLYGVHEVRRVMEGVLLTSVHPAFVRRARALGLDLASLQLNLAAHPSIQHLTHIPEELRRLFVTAHDVSPEHHVRMQAVFQRYSDSGVSKTINLPATATKAEVAAAFLLAYQLGCKGLTVYRTGSREEQVFSCSPSHPC
ncbi:MAG TPA: adenosylcobalamin-dependent ribonucleoside-diphosphate reductase [Nitrospiraceae bacterium]|nr:adenosylcobalamin-dependent ribonucleoside-diphosphate reductase [Nitrospiraceae bacterium]